MYPRNQKNVFSFSQASPQHRSVLPLVGYSSAASDFLSFQVKPRWGWGCRGKVRFVLVTGLLMLEVYKFLPKTRILNLTHSKLYILLENQLFLRRYCIEKGDTLNRGFLKKIDKNAKWTKKCKGFL